MGPTQKIRRMRRGLTPIPTLKALRPQFALAAQKIYDEWEQDEEGNDEELGSGGICDLISREISGILSENGWETTEGSQDGDDHSFVLTFNPNGKSKKIYTIDIPNQVYERGGGYTWKKIPGVKFNQEHILIGNLKINQDEFYIQ